MTNKQPNGGNMWSEKEISQVGFLVSYLESQIKLLTKAIRKRKGNTDTMRTIFKVVKKYMETEHKTMEDMHFQMGIQEGFSNAMDRHKKAG
jgi:hypothetical protein